MQTYQLFIDDDRYSVLTLKLLTVKDADCARDWMAIAMLDSPHHLGAEIYRGGARLFGTGSLAERRHWEPAGKAQAQAEPLG